MKKTKLFCKVIFILAIVSIYSCKDDPLPTPDIEEAPKLTQKINKFIYDGMNDIYLWYDKLPEIDNKHEIDSKKYFYKLLYKDDKWSFITDDLKALENSFKGVEKTFGYSLAFGKFINNENYFAIIEYVYPGTPAWDSELKRGDIIVLINGSAITADGLYELLNSENITINLGIQDGNQIAVDPSPIELTAESLSLDPVLYNNIYDIENHKIGYLFYTQYIHEYKESIDNVLEYFKSEGITDLILDLRYNPGGGIDAAQYLCSSIAPVDVVNNKKTLVTFQWNNKYQKHFKDIDKSDELETTFINTTKVKLNLNKLSVITGKGTASASELTITGLKPYMDITTLGDTTAGKYTASITLKPEFFYTDKDYYNDFENWAMQPIVLRYANALGETDFKDGFAPDIVVEDDYFSNVQIGSTKEPILKAAIENITGKEIATTKTTRTKSPYKIIDRGFSKYDKNKKELTIDYNMLKDKK